MKVVVTGGGGFVGSALAKALLARGYSVIALGRSRYPHLEQAGISAVQIDLSSEPERLVELCAGAGAVFHTAAHVKMWGRYDEFLRGNVVATRNVIAACRAAAVPKLIFTSSPSVVADGTNLRAVNESYPYPVHYEAFYPMTKAVAEREVLAANSAAFKTIALRPHLIFGPGDTNLVPTILLRARAGRLVQVGDGKNLVDLTYIDDCIAAHLGALDALKNRPTAAGRAYFISQGTPVPLWEWIGRVLALHGLPPVTRRIPQRLAQVAAGAVEIVWNLLGVRKDPPLTKFLASEMATDHYFDISAARTELGFQPRYSVWEATEHAFGGLARQAPSSSLRVAS